MSIYPRSRILAILLPLVLSACGGGAGVPAVAAEQQTPQQQLAALEANGSIPKLDRSSALAGTDSDGNGVRDDIDVFIDANYVSRPQRAAARQVASSLQAALMSDLTSRKDILAISIRSGRAINCIFRIFDGKNGSKIPDAVANEIESMTTNTKARLLKYLAYSKALNGESLSLPNGDTCE